MDEKVMHVSESSHECFFAQASPGNEKEIDPVALGRRAEDFLDAAQSIHDQHYVGAAPLALAQQQHRLMNHGQAPRPMHPTPQQQQHQHQNFYGFYPPAGSPQMPPPPRGPAPPHPAYARFYPPQQPPQGG